MELLTMIQVCALGHHFSVASHALEVFQIKALIGQDKKRGCKYIPNFWKLYQLWWNTYPERDVDLMLRKHQDPSVPLELCSSSANRGSGKSHWAPTSISLLWQTNSDNNIEDNYTFRHFRHTQPPWTPQSNHCRQWNVALQSSPETLVLQVTFYVTGVLQDQAKSYCFKQGKEKVSVTWWLLEKACPLIRPGSLHFKHLSRVLNTSATSPAFFSNKDDSLHE